MHTFGEFFHFFFYVMCRGGSCVDMGANFDLPLVKEKEIVVDDKDDYLNDVADGLFD